MIHPMKRKTISHHRDFCVPSNCFRVVEDCFILKAAPTKTPGDPRYGLVVSKRAFKFAVERNRAKRLMRDWIAANENCMNPKLDYIFIVNHNVLNCTREIGRQKVNAVLKSVSKTKLCD